MLYISIDRIPLEILFLLWKRIFVQYCLFGVVWCDLFPRKAIQESRLIEVETEQIFVVSVNLPYMGARTDCFLLELKLHIALAENPLE